MIAFKNGNQWAEEAIRTTDEPAGLEANADRNEICADGKDLSFITVRVKDKNGWTVPTATNAIRFEITGPGEIVATDNGDATNFTPFPSHERNSFSGLALVIVRAKQGQPGSIKITAHSPGLEACQVIVNTKTKE